MGRYAGPGCPYGGLDFSPSLFKHFADESVGVFYMNWAPAGSGSGNNNGGNDDAEAKKSKEAAAAASSSSAAAAWGASPARPTFLSPKPPTLTPDPLRSLVLIRRRRMGLFVVLPRRSMGLLVLERAQRLARVVEFVIRERRERSCVRGCCVARVGPVGRVGRVGCRGSFGVGRGAVDCGGVGCFGREVSLLHFSYERRHLQKKPRLTCFPRAGLDSVASAAAESASAIPSATLSSAASLSPSGSQSASASASGAPVNVAAPAIPAGAVGGNLDSIAQLVIAMGNVVAAQAAKAQ